MAYSKFHVRLTDSEQQQIAFDYYALYDAVCRDPSSPKVQQLHRRLAAAYRAYTTRLIGELPSDPSQRRRWVARLYYELVAQISEENWSLARGH
jgi:hypothetical protein